MVEESLLKRAALFLLLRTLVGGFSCPLIAFAIAAACFVSCATLSTDVLLSVILNAKDTANVSAR